VEAAFTWNHLPPSGEWCVNGSKNGFEWRHETASGLSFRQPVFFHAPEHCVHCHSSLHFLPKTLYITPSKLIHSLFQQFLSSSIFFVSLYLSSLTFSIFALFLLLLLHIYISVWFSSSSFFFLAGLFFSAFPGSRTFCVTTVLSLSLSLSLSP